MLMRLNSFSVFNFSFISQCATGLTQQLKQLSCHCQATELKAKYGAYSNTARTDD